MADKALFPSGIMLELKVIRLLRQEAGSVPQLPPPGRGVVVVDVVVRSQNGFVNHLERGTPHYRRFDPINCMYIWHSYVKAKQHVKFA